MPDSLTDYDWLATDEASLWLDQLASEPSPTPKLVQRLRQSLTAQQTHLLLAQAELRQRATEKFPQAQQMLFTRRGLEQSTDAFLARFKAERFPADRPVYDLCCGIGGDALSLAARGTCHAIDLDPIMAWISQYNATALGLNFLQANCADVTHLDLAGSLWHLDPDRRMGGRRHTRVAGYQPGIEFLARLVAETPGGAIKLAPAAELPTELQEGAELQWLSRGGECKQLVAWYGELARQAGERTASLLDRQGNLIDQVSGREQHPEEAPRAEAIGRYVFDPDAAVLAAHLTGCLARERNLTVIDPLSSYLTGDHLPTTGNLAAFEVLDQLPLDVRRLRQVLDSHNIGRLELKKRGAPVELPSLAKKLRTKGTQPGTVIVSAWQGQTVAIVCRRV